MNSQNNIWKPMKPIKNNQDLVHNQDHILGHIDFLHDL